MEVINSTIDKIKADVSYDIILPEIIEMVRFFLTKDISKNQKEISKLIKRFGTSVRRECPTAFPIFNFLTRILIMVEKNEEVNPTVPDNTQSNKMLFRFLTENIKDRVSEFEIESGSKNMEILNELTEFESINEDIIEVAKLHVNEGEIVLVFGQSELMREFITSSCEEKKFSLLVVQNSLVNNSKAMDFRNKDVTHISESMVFSVMSRVNKIFVDCHAVMADGAVFALSGTFNIAAVAKEFSVPLIVLAPLYRFAPFYAFAQDSFNDYLKPQRFFPEAYSLKNLEVVVAKYDLVASDFVTFFITQFGEFSNSYIYRAFAEYYGEMDYGYEF